MNILHSAWGDTSAVWTEPSSWKTLLKTTSCFWTWDDTECAWQSRPFKGRQVKKRRGKGKGKHKGISKRGGRAFLGEEQAQDSEMWSKEDFAWWTKGPKGKKGLSKGNDGFQKGGFRPYQPDKGAGKDYPRTKARESIKKEKARKKLVPNLDFQLLKYLKKKDIAMPGNLTTGLPVSGLMILGLQVLGGKARKAPTASMAVPSLNLAYHPTHVVLDVGCTRSIESRAAIERYQKHSWYYGITRELCRCNKSFVFANSGTESCLEICIIHFPTTPPWLMCLRQVMYLFYFRFLRRENLGTTIELDPHERQDYMPSFWLVFLSSCKFHNGTYCVGPDESYVSAHD